MQNIIKMKNQTLRKEVELLRPLQLQMSKLQTEVAQQLRHEQQH